MDLGRRVLFGAVVFALSTAGWLLFHGSSSPRGQGKPLSKHDDGDWLERGAANEEPDGGTLTSSVAYDCGWLPQHEACQAGASAIESLMSDLRSLGVAGGYGPSPPESATPAEVTLARVRELDLARLSLRERVALQNTLLGLSLSAQARSTMGMATAEMREHGRKLTLAAVQAMKFVALSPSELDGLGTEPEAALDAWLGPRNAWIDRQTPSPSLFHDSLFGYRVHFRPILAGSVRAIFGQLAAVDSAFGVHITPFVAELELRHGRAHVAPACIAQLDLRCGLQAVSLAEGARHNPLLTAAENAQVACEACHQAAAPNINLVSVPASEASRVVTARRSAFLSTLEREVLALPK